MALTDNLQGYWKLDEASGNASDSSGNSNTLTNNGTVTYINPAVIGNGALFVKASSQNLSITNAAQTGLGLGSGDYSWSWWMNLTQLPSTAGTDMVIMAKYDIGTVPNGFDIIIEHAGAQADKMEISMIGDGASTDLNQFRANTALTAGDVGAWHHWVMAFTFVGSNCSCVFYKDGSSVANTRTFNQITTSINSNTNAWRMGAVDNSGVAGDFLDGKLDEVGVWNRALTSGEVTSLYNSGAGLQYPFSGGGASFTNKRALLGVGI